MLTHLDEFGRIVIPHALREVLGLKPGDSLDLSWTGSEIRIKPATEDRPMAVRTGILVYEARSEEGATDFSLEEERRRRMRKVMKSDQG